MKAQKAFQRGAVVKLTDRYAAALCSSPKNRIDWMTRRGIVKSCGKHDVGISWPGRASLDQVPIKAVEQV